MPEALLAVDQGGGEVVAGHRGVGPWMHEPGAGPLDVPGQHADAVRVDPPQVGADHEIGGQGRVAARHLERLEHRADEGGQGVDGDGDGTVGGGRGQDPLLRAAR